MDFFLKQTKHGFIDIKPAAYNVVLEEDTYKGQLKIEFKFVANVRLDFFFFSFFLNVRKINYV
jgi:hypothetical protein